MSYKYFDKNSPLDKIFLLAHPRIERDNTMSDKMMYIPNDDTFNYPFCRLHSI